jgi:hypothetical protein
MKNSFLFLVPLVVMLSCNISPENKDTKSERIPIQGTWKLLSGMLIEKGDTTVTDYTKEKEFIKIINDTHFAFLSHDLSKGKNADSLFSAGGGNYSLQDSSYTEHLAYCNDRQWEGNDFHFTVSIHNDTLIQQGIEKIDSLGVDRVNVEKYVRAQKGL